MKILVVAPLAPQTQPTNAVPLVTNALLAALAPRHELTLLTATDYGQRDDAALAQWEARGVRVHCVVREQAHGKRRWEKRQRMATRWLQGVPWRTVWYEEPGLQKCLDTLLAREAFDLITVEDNAAGIYDFRATTPKVLTEMEVRSPEPPQKGLTQTAFRRFLSARDAQHWQTFQRAVWKKFNRVQVLTQRDANSIQALAPEISRRTRVNPFGIELPAAVDVEHEKRGQIVFVGGFTHAPNVDAAHWLAREIFPRIQACCANAELVLVGSYPPESVRALAMENVTVAANVAAVEPFLQEASVVVAPLRQGGGQRMKVLQGMAHGKAVVATPLAAEGLNLYGAPPLELATDAEQFAEVVAELLALPLRRHELGGRARAFVETHYSPCAYADRLENVYCELLRETR